MLQEGWDMEEIVQALAVSAKSIGRWADNYTEQDRVDPPSVLRGRPRILNTKVLDELTDLIKEMPSLYLDELAEWLAIYHDQPISTSALHNNLVELGLTHKLLHKTAAERDEVARTQWIHDVTSHYTAAQMVFIDESSKDNRTLVRHYGRAPSGEDPVEVVRFDRGERWSILPALTLEGYIALRVVPGSVNGMELYDFIVNDLVRC